MTPAQRDEVVIVVIFALGALCAALDYFGLLVN